MKTGTKAKFSEHGLEWLYPVLDHRRQRAIEQRFEVVGYSRDGECLRVKHLSTPKHYSSSFHWSFLEPAN